MKTKIGISIFMTAVATAAVMFFLERKRINNQIKFDLDTNNYFSKPYDYNPANSFVEFFEKDSLKEAYSRYEKYLDLGLNKDDAFKSVVEDDRNT